MNHLGGSVRREGPKICATLDASRHLRVSIPTELLEQTQGLGLFQKFQFIVLPEVGYDTKEGSRNFCGDCPYSISNGVLLITLPVARSQFDSITTDFAK